MNCVAAPGSAAARQKGSERRTKLGDVRFGKPIHRSAWKVPYSIS
jgi:hypothetical protein